MTISTTAKNTAITEIADIIQKARQQLLNGSDSTLTCRSSKWIIMICLLYISDHSEDSVNSLTTFSDVLKALKIERCFPPELLGSQLCDVDIQDTMTTLSSVRNIDNWNEFAFYAYEAFEYEPDVYFLADRNRGIRNTIIKKKQTGIYYTPHDVVSFMSEQCLTQLLERVKKPTVLDCSCGSGAFLLQYFRTLDNTYNRSSEKKQSLELLKQCIWGVDISESAVDACRMTFIHYFYDKYDSLEDLLEKLWAIIGENFVVGDSTKFESVLNEHSSMPDSYDCIIGNPPYVSLGKNSNLYIDFVYKMMSLSKDNSFSSLVLPLSICFSSGSKYRELRSDILNDNAQWTFLNFDRSPDSLFGDQIKTRNTIVLRDASIKKKSLFTSPLLRWTSSSRRTLFKNIPVCDISNTNIIDVIPKLSNIVLKEAYDKINSGNDNILKMVNDMSSNSSQLFMNGTAYNWLCVYDHIPPSIDERGELYKPSSMKTLTFENDDDRNFCIAVLSNRIAYWYWTTVGDGFHLNASFLSSFKIGKKMFTEKGYSTMSKLGKEYSERVKKHPKESRNAGKTIINYSHHEAMDIVESIESELIKTISLSSDFKAFIKAWYDNQIYCKRGN